MFLDKQEVTFFFFFETGSYYVIGAGLKLTVIPLRQPPQLLSTEVTLMHHHAQQEASSCTKSPQRQGDRRPASSVFNSPGCLHERCFHMQS